jgi:hypothetical protein
MTKTKLLPSRDLKTLLDQYPEACKNPDKLRGWKRARTLYCNWRAEETGRPAWRFLAGVRAALTRRKYDMSHF